MEIHDSIFRLTHGTTVILDYGDPLTESSVVLDGRQLVKPAELVKGAGILTFPRGNESHQLEFSKIDVEYSTRNAMVSAISHALAAPRDSRDLLIELENGWAWKIASASVESWPSEADNTLSIRSMIILGGKLSLVSSGSLDAPV